MNRRAIVIVKDKYEKLYFYRHSDGYPSGTLPTLKQFMLLIKDKKIRDNVGQAAGWLVLIGADEYGVRLNPDKMADDGRDWKVGAYEPATGIGLDTEWVYVLDLTEMLIEIKKPIFNWKAKHGPKVGGFKLVEKITDFGPAEHDDLNER